MYEKDAEQGKALRASTISTSRYHMMRVLLAAAVCVCAAVLTGACWRSAKTAGRETGPARV